MLSRPTCAALALCFLFGGSTVSAQEEPEASVEEEPGAPDGMVTYEDLRTRDALVRENLVPVDVEAAEGKRIAFVRVVRDDVFLEEDGGFFGWLTWANIFHTRTQEHIVEREVLFEAGDAFSAAGAAETRRNLMDMAIFSYARVVPVAFDNEDEVGVVVYTRDLWSLRLESNFQVTGATIDFLQLQLSERNLFGLQKRATARFVLVPDTFRFGQVYADRRLFDLPIRLGEAVDFIFNRDSGDLEGFSGVLSVQSPFYDLDQRWGFSLEGSVLTHVERQLRGGQVLLYDLPETEEEEALRREWREREYDASAFVLYRQGEGYKQTFGVGIRYDEVDVELVPGEVRSVEEEAALRRDILPRERRDLGPALTYNLFVPTFVDFENLAAYGVTESVRTGPYVNLRFGFPLSAFGSSSDSMTVEGEYGYILGVDGFLFDASLFAAARLEDGDVVDQRFEVDVRGATPVIGIGRFAFRARFQGRDRDTSRGLVTLGGDNGLRGFVSQALSAQGGSLLGGNIEFRTLPVEIWSAHLGLAVFYDVGTVYNDTSEIELHHAVGIGVRAMFPQFNRLPFRFDAGAPVGEDGFSVVPSFGANHSIPLTAYEDSLVL